MNHAASLKIDDLLWKKCVLFLGKQDKKQAALKAIAGHCVFKINASFYLFAILLFTFFFSRLLQEHPGENFFDDILFQVSKVKYSTIFSLICLRQS